MSVISAIRGIRPRVDIVSRVVAPPYDVLDSEEGRDLAHGNPQSWLHVSKPEIDLESGIDPYDDRVYEKARENFNAFMEKGYFVRDLEPVLYVYRLSIDGHSQTGIIAGASVAEYESNLICKHELTRADKELDRTRHTEMLEAHTGPVFLTYRQRDDIDKIVADVTSTEPYYNVRTFDGVTNQIWIVTNPDQIRQAFLSVPCLYIADGHHRAASYCKLGARKRDANPGHTGDEAYNYFLAVIFPHNQLRILPYNRIVADLNGMTADQFLERVRPAFEISTPASPSPTRRHAISMYLAGSWYGLVPREGTIHIGDNGNDGDKLDPVKSLDVSILQDNLLAPILAIIDPRKDKRIDFVGGIRGTGELERRVGKSGGVAFSLYPTSTTELMAISDAGKIMPPKSTWFEPKLKDGFVIHDVSR